MPNTEDPYSMDYDSDHKPEPRHDGIMIQEGWWVDPRPMTLAKLKTLLDNEEAASANLGTRPKTKQKEQ